MEFSTETAANSRVRQRTNSMNAFNFDLVLKRCIGRYGGDPGIEVGSTGRTAACYRTLLPSLLDGPGRELWAVGRGAAARVLSRGPQERPTINSHSTCKRDGLIGGMESLCAKPPALDSLDFDHVGLLCTRFRSPHFTNHSTICGWQVKTSTWFVCARPINALAALIPRSGSKLTSASSITTGRVSER